MKPTDATSQNFTQAAALLALGALAILPACGDAESGGAGSGTTSGAQPPACAPGEMPLEDGGCQPAGIPPERCGKGFEPDGTMGCNAVLPPEACPPGQMAIPGDVACRAVAPCADGDYGDIPVDAATQFVNAGYAGNDSDGTQARPWTRIQDAVDAADPGAIVAIAAGTYTGWFHVRFKAVRIWGRCPSMVEVAGDSTEYATVFLEDGIAGTEVRDIAIVGVQAGVTSSGSEDVLLDRVWIHDTQSRGINVQNDWGPTAIAVRRSLVEGAREFGVFLHGSKLSLEDSVVRDTQPVAGNFGRALNAQSDPMSNVRAEMTVIASVLERNRETAVYLAGSDATIERTVVRDTLAQASDGLLGRGISAEDALETGEGSTLILTSSIVERNRDAGVAIARSKATIELTVVRDTLPREADQQFGRGINFQPFGGLPAEATIRWSLCERNVEVGAFFAETNVIIEGLRVRDTRSRSVELDRGGGIAIQGQGPAAPASIRWSVVERNHEVGIYIFDHDATVDGSAVFDTEQSEGAGLLGDGVSVSSAGTPRAVSVAGSLVQGSARSGVSSFGAAVALQGDTLECNAIDLDAEELTETGAGFSDLGGNRCSCGAESWACKALSSGLVPPEPLPVTE